MSEIEINPDVFHGELTANRAQVFVRVPRSPEWNDCTLAGFVHGPHCEYAHTLPAKFALQDLGEGPTLLARAIVTDPCLWTSDLPHTYDVQIELRRGGQTLASERRSLGLRGLGWRETSAGHRLVREGKVWIPRGVKLRSLRDEDLVLFRDQLLAGVHRGLPPLDWLQTASRRGLYSIIDLTDLTGDLIQTLRQLARWPAVMMVMLTGDHRQDLGLQQVAPNLLLGQRASILDLATFTPATWAHALVVEMEEEGPELARLKFAEQAGLPVVLQNADNGLQDPQNPRAACDALQAAAAPFGQFAGYLAGK